MLHLAQTADEKGRQSVGTPLYIEGVAVDALMEEVYNRTPRDGVQVENPLQIDVITWEPLFVAADRARLLDILHGMVRLAFGARSGGHILLRVFPSHDDVCITFQIASEGVLGYRCRSCNDGDDLLNSVRMCIADMGGELTAFEGESGFSVSFWLPQWITEDMACIVVRQYVA